MPRQCLAGHLDPAPKRKEPRYKLAGYLEEIVEFPQTVHIVGLLIVSSSRMSIVSSGCRVQFYEQLRLDIGNRVSAPNIRVLWLWVVA